MFFTKTPGIGGKIKVLPRDFIVNEIPIVRRSGGNQTVFWMEKINWDGNLAIKILADELGIDRKKIGVAGTKDKRAVTKQKVSISGISKEKVKKIKINGLRFYSFSTGKRIHLGDLEGNEFKITIKGIKLGPSIIRNRLDKVFKELKNGIPNVFGPQRFGENVKMGKIILKKNRPLNKVPKKLQKLFVHSVQSRIFNLTAEEVWKRRIRVGELPLIGFDTKLDKRNNVSKLVSSILREEGIKLSHFKVRGHRELSCRETKRDYLLKPNNLRIIKLEKSQVIIGFTLPAGSYATVVLGEIMKYK